jgi:glycosyltransferase involved in cell wall biosynthesis
VRLFYFASVSNTRLDRELGRQLDIPSGRNKVLGVCAAVRQQGVFVTVVTALAPQSPMRVFSKARLYRSDGVCVAQLFTLGRGAVRRIVASYSLLLFAITALSREDYVVFYNYYPEYLPSALFLRLRGRTPIFDIEDSPRRDQTGPWDLVNRICFPLMKWLCDRKYLIVSKTLARKLGLERSLAVYGVADYFTNGSNAIQRFTRSEVNIHYGGALMRATGLDLFMDAVRHLVASEPGLCAHFHVTGLFEPEALHQFAADISGRSRIQVSVYGKLMMSDYRALMDTMDIGLCLKLPSTDMGQTTFPSKVVEIAALGLLLCSTSVSDVPLIFDDTNALVLKSEDVGELAAALSSAIRDRDQSKKRAEQGRRLALRRFSKACVGADIVDFLRE